MTWGWNIENWKTHDRFEEADKACKHACGRIRRGMGRYKWVQYTCWIWWSSLDVTRNNGGSDCLPVL